MATFVCYELRLTDNVFAVKPSNKVKSLAVFSPKTKKISCKISKGRVCH